MFAAVTGLIDITYPVDWLLFRHDAADSLQPMKALSPLAVRRNPQHQQLAGHLPGGHPRRRRRDRRRPGWPGRINAGDRRLIRGLLGPSRVSELERTRTLAVEDAAAALRRVERDLHDGAQMRLAALAMNLGMAREKLGGQDEQAGAADNTATVRELIDAAQRNAMDALADLRDLARGIHPPALDNGLPSALATLAASSAIPASVSAELGRPPRAGHRDHRLLLRGGADGQRDQAQLRKRNQDQHFYRTGRRAPPRGHRRRHRRGGRRPRQRPGRPGPAGVHGGRATWRCPARRAARPR